MPNRAALLFERYNNFLDHLMPFCDLFNMPLITNRIDFLSDAKYFYPQADCIFTDDPTMTLASYDTLFYGSPYKNFASGIQFPTFYYPHTPTTYCTLHGNSEKYLNSYWLERLVDEDGVFIYGSLFYHLLQEKGILSRLKTPPFICGNLRYLYYQKYKSFFSEKMVSFLPKQRGDKVVLWAPTWRPEAPDAFFSQARAILPMLPKGWQIIIKMHPLLQMHYIEESIALEQTYHRESVFFVKELPLIYPLLDHVDLFLGDGSSMEYDFLTFQRALFFLDQETRKMHHFGRVIYEDDYDRIFQMMDIVEQPELRERREGFYHYVFADERNFGHGHGEWEGRK